MDEKIMRLIAMCNQMIALLERDYLELHRHLRGELYEEYKSLMLEEIERVEQLKRKIKSVAL